MLLSLLSSSRPLRRIALLVSLLINVATIASSDDGPPGVLSVIGQCPTTTASWSSTSGAFFYMYILFYNGSVMTTGIIPGTSQSFTDLSPGNYALEVQAFTAFGSTGFSAPYNFTIKPCVTCKAPVVRMDSVNPSTLWPPNGQSVAVQFRGAVTSDCPITQAAYVLTDTDGSGDQGSVSVASDGSFQVNLSLVASRAGTDKNGRVYGLSLMASNAVGSTTGSTLNVTVPHDQGH